MSHTSRRPSRPAASQPTARTVTLEFPEWVRHLRAKADFASDDELIVAAREALPSSLRQGLNRRWLASLLAGEVEFDQVPVVRWMALAKALGVTVEDLIGAKPADRSATATELDALAQLLGDTWSTT